uniref:Uncharacterized protein n=1 Tax=Romanomermis culicivorax TaxID=13658 RepID=A0A915KZI5_ROMCU
MMRARERDENETGTQQRPRLGAPEEWQCEGQLMLKVNPKLSLRDFPSLAKYEFLDEARSLNSGIHEIVGKK